MSESCRKILIQSDGCKIIEKKGRKTTVKFFCCVTEYTVSESATVKLASGELYEILYSETEFSSWDEFINTFLNSKNCNCCMSDNVNNGVGANPIPEKLKGTWHQDLTTGTYADSDLLALAVAQGATFSDGTTAITATNAVIEQIEIDLKPVNGHGQIWDGTQFVQQTSTAADATYTDNGGVTDLDPGGSRDSATCQGSTFEEVTVGADSIVTVAIVFCEA